jgi:NADH dehydrogenase
VTAVPYAGLRERGVELGLGTSVKEATSDGVHLTDGRFVPSRTLVWCVGVCPDPLTRATGLATEKGRLKVDEYLQPSGHPEVFALGDGAAVPDPQDPSKPCPMTAQHATRQAEVAARNVAASFGVGERRPYWRKSLGFVVDLGGWSAAANPLGVPLSGPARPCRRPGLPPRGAAGEPGANGGRLALHRCGFAPRRPARAHAPAIGPARHRRPRARPRTRRGG